MDKTRYAWKIKNADKIRLRFLGESRRYEYRYFEPTLKGLHALKRACRRLLDNIPCPAYGLLWQAYARQKTTRVWARLTASLWGMGEVNQMINEMRQEE